MTRGLLLALAALLVVPAWAQSYEPPVTPSATVRFAGRQPITVRGPASTVDVRWQLRGVLYAQGGRWAAAHWCWEAIKFDGCSVTLVEPEGRRTVLTNPDVQYLAFTRDGRWLVGSGWNTVRVWNPVSPRSRPRTRAFADLHFWRMDLASGGVCLRASGGGSGKQAERLLTVPGLRPVRASTRQTTEVVYRKGPDGRVYGMRQQLPSPVGDMQPVC